VNEADRNARRLASQAHESETTIMFIVVLLALAFLIGATWWVLPL
jgi:cobalamin biosynthesis Mg chelatase CobN